MNGKRAKQFRLIAYGMSRHQDENVANDPRHREYNVDSKGVVRNTGQRAVYLRLKKRYKLWVKKGRPHGTS